MKKSKAQINRCSTRHKNRGMALLLMLSLLIVLLTTVVIARLSLNDLAQKRQTATLKALTETRDAIMAWTLTQSFLINRPPGTLPCPDSDTNRDGRLNLLPGGTGCVSRVGLVPFRDLGIPEPLDSYGNPLWYAVATEYVGNANTTLPLPPRNSSLPSTLILEGKNGSNQRSVAFIVMAANEAQFNQAQITRPVMANIVNFLDGKNADGNLNIFTDQSTPDDSSPNIVYNDQVIAMPVGAFWSAVEMGVLSEVANLLQTYNDECGSYPWAADFSENEDISDSGFLEGRVPLEGTDPPAPDWGQVCSGGTAPTMPPWLSTHWRKMLYYSMCLPISPLCLQLQDDNNALLQTASVVIIAPGVPLSGFTRSPSAPINEFFEGQNTTINDQVFQLIPSTNHPNNFNDVTKSVVPTTAF